MSRVNEAEAPNTPGNAEAATRTVYGPEGQRLVAEFDNTNEKRPLLGALSVKIAMGRLELAGYSLTCTVLIIAAGAEVQLSVIDELLANELALVMEMVAGV